jgi:membrane protease subunit HflK
LPRARGQAAQIREEALAYKKDRSSRARGQAARFTSLLTEYRKDPEIFKERVFLQTLESVLPRLRTYVVDEKPGDPRTTVKMIEAGRN